jgi:hypothetical protein
MVDTWMRGVTAYLDDVAPARPPVADGDRYPRIHAEPTWPSRATEPTTSSCTDLTGWLPSPGKYLTATTLPPQVYNPAVRSLWNMADYPPGTELPAVDLPTFPRWLRPFAARRLARKLEMRRKEYWSRRST